MKPSKICVIEPHSNDAFLSLGYHMEKLWKEEEVTILTVFSGTRRRGEQAKNYADAIGASWVGLGWLEGSPIDLSQSVLPEADRYILPLAITHQEHIDVREAFEREFFLIPFEYYLDIPYCQKIKNGEIVTMKSRGKGIKSYAVPHVSKFKHIPIFKDQHMFFYNNPAEDLKKCPEIILETIL